MQKSKLQGNHPFHILYTTWNKQIFDILKRVQVVKAVKDIKRSEKLVGLIEMTMKNFRAAAMIKEGEETEYCELNVGVR